MATLPIQFLGSFPGTRVWFLSESGSHLVQVQGDRLVVNWRKTPDSQEYPRYHTLSPQFAREAEELLAFLSEENLVQPEISQAEVGYINPIPVASLGEQRDLSRLVAPWSGHFSDAFLSHPEDTRLGLRFRIPHPTTGEPIGRLYVEVNSAVHRPLGVGGEEEVYLVQLFARGRPIGAGLEGALAFLDVGHDWVVRGFTSLTTEPMQREWGKQR